MTEQITEAPSTLPSGVRLPGQPDRSKSDTLRRLLSRRHGATVAQIQKQLGWQPHTVRAAISRLRSSGLSIDFDRSGKVARYRAASGDEQ
jgi:predicted ArsR family transcriptional regulator